MCLIVVKPKNVDYPIKEHLINADSYNSDGIGVAYCKVEREEVIIKKNFKNVTEFLEWMYATIRKEDVLVIHFRWATSGLKDIGNRHPFPITNNKDLLRQPNSVCQYAVAHNGIISQYSGHEKYSDTQKFVIDILNDEAIKNNLNSEAVRKLINSYIGGDRLAILSKTGEVYIFGEFQKEGEIYMSNTSYKYETRRGFIGYEYAGFQSVNASERDISYVTKCDGCYQNKLCRMMAEDYLLCKSCRRKYKKGKLNLAIEEEETIAEFSKSCANCSDWVTKTHQLMNVEVCEKCYEYLMEQNKVD